jgi:hypothetical protein
MITEKNNVFNATADFLSEGCSGAHDCADGLRINWPSLQARCAALAARMRG